MACRNGGARLGNNKKLSVSAFQTYIQHSFKVNCGSKNRSENMRTADTRYVDARMRYPTLLPPPPPFSPSLLSCVFCRSLSGARRTSARSCTAPCGATRTCPPACPTRSRTPEGPGCSSAPTLQGRSWTRTGWTWWCAATSASRRASTCPSRTTRRVSRPPAKELVFFYIIYSTFFSSVDRLFGFAAFCFVSWMDYMGWGVAVSLCLVWLACGGGSFEGGFGLRFEYVCTRWCVCQPEAMLP